MNRFQPRFPPGKNFHSKRKLLCQSHMGLPAALAFRAASPRILQAVPAHGRALLSGATGHFLAL
jgi:hypothetical protein